MCVCFFSLTFFGRGNSKKDVNRKHSEYVNMYDKPDKPARSSGITKILTPYVEN